MPRKLHALTLHFTMTTTTTTTTTTEATEAPLVHTERNKRPRTEEASASEHVQHWLWHYSFDHQQPKNGDLRSLFASVRTTRVSSPRPGVSFYLSSARNDPLLACLLGLYPVEWEVAYREQWRDLYCRQLWLERIRILCPQLEPEKLLLDGSSSTSRTLTELQQRIVTLDPTLRLAQLQHEYDRIRVHNATLANAVWQRWLAYHDIWSVHSLRWQHSSDPHYSRVTLSLYDPAIDLRRPPPLALLPCLSQLLQSGPEAVLQNMVDAVWDQLVRKGYYASAELQAQLAPSLMMYLRSGLVRDGPLSL